MTSSRESLSPVVIGVGEIRNKHRKLGDALEPAELIIKAFENAMLDSQADPAVLRGAIDSIDVVEVWTWPYPDLPSLLSAKLGLSTTHKDYSPRSGCWPCRFLDRTAQRIVEGTTKVGLVCGGEALASLNLYAAAKQTPPWTPVPNPPSTGSKNRNMTGNRVGYTQRHGISTPVQMYPLFENALRARTSQSKASNEAESAELYAEFAQIAATKPTAWAYGEKPLGRDEIGTVSKRNRMICYPYPLVQNAFNGVNCAAAVLVCSQAQAAAMGVPKEKWVYVWSAAGTQDETDYLLRPVYWKSPSLSASLDAAIDAANITKDDIDAFDIYSCFPIVPKLAAHHLGIPVTREQGRTKPVSLIGGLTSFGGAGNNYSMHALAEMVRQIRAGTYRVGCVLANGGITTYHHAAVLAATSRPDASTIPFKSGNLPTIMPSDVKLVEHPDQGIATIETYTVEYSRDGKAVRAFIVGRLESTGERFLANEEGPETLAYILRADEPIGTRGIVSSVDGGNKNVFKVEAATL